MAAGEGLNPIFILDGSSLVYRSFYAFIRNPLRNSKGQNTSAVFGFVSSLRKLFERFRPQFMAVVFDAPKATFRHKAFKEYKIQRPETPDELRSQVPLVKEVVQAYGLKVLEVEGYEADDVLASLAVKFKREGHRVVLVSSDKDLLQMVGEGVVLYDPYREQEYDPDWVLRRYGVEPHQIVDLLALAGDQIDNIPGVPGIGEKRAQEIVRRYGSVERAVEIEPRLKGYKDLALLSKRLTQLWTDLELHLELEDLRVGRRDEQRLFQLFRELEFISLIKELGLSGEGKALALEPLSTPERLSESDPIVLCWAGDGLLLTQPQLGLGFKIPHRDRPLLDAVLRSPALKIGFDLKGMRHELKKLGLTLFGPEFDLKIASWLCDPNRKRYEFSDLLLTHLALAPTTLTPAQSLRCSLDLYDHLKERLKTEGMDGLFFELEMPLIQVLYEMETRGAKIDREFFKALSSELSQELRRIETEVYRLCGVRFNLNSPKQLSNVLFQVLGLKPLRRTKTGYSTDVGVLEELAPTHPVPRLLLRYRELQKLVSTYLDPLVAQSDPETHRVHASFNQTGTATGRLSSSNPNLQNIPIRGELGHKIRQGFIAANGYELISADYSQIELRILAHLSQDPELISAFNQDEDIHTRTACTVLGITPKEMTEQARRMAKMVNYGLIYGMSEFGLASGLGIPQEEAQGFIAEYMARYQGVARYREAAVAQAERDGFTSTLLGRRRPIPELNSSNRNVYELGRRLAINTPIQGSAADLMKLSMIKIDRRLKEEGIKGGIIIQVHDELLLEIECSGVDEAAQIVQEEMEGAFKLRVPLKAHLGRGRTWAEAH